MKTKTIIQTIGMGILLIVTVMSFIPIYNLTLSDSKINTGVVEWIMEKGGPSDIFIQIQNDERIYYINRGAENGINPRELNSKLAGKVIKIHHAKHWTPLDPFNRDSILPGSLRTIPLFIMKQPNKK